MEQQGAVLYHEPSILTVLIQSSFLLALGCIDFILDSLVYCGLIGQILVGLAYGTPGGDILGTAFQQTITDLGYLGLILLVFEGGLSTDIRALRSNALLSILVALTGISLPIGISFVLVVMCNASTLQAFAAGCTLSSTSLGTTFTIMKASGLDKSRLGIVLTSAAMLDDVVGLVLVQVISNLGSSGQDFTAVTVVRPVFVSLAYALIVPLALFVWKRLNLPSCTGRSPSKLVCVLRSTRGQLIMQTVVLIAGVASAAYAGTSTLLAAYLAGLLIVSCESMTWSQEQLPSPKANEKKTFKNEGSSETQRNIAPGDTGPWELIRIANSDKIESSPSAPITQGSSSDKSDHHPKSKKAEDLTDQKTDKPSEQDDQLEKDQAHSIDRELLSNTTAAEVFNIYYAQPLNRILRPFFFASIGFSIPITRLFAPQILWRGIVYAILMTFGKACCGLWLIRFTSAKSTPAHAQAPNETKVQRTLSRLATYRPQSVYPACMLGSAMVARGEIGFLISAIAETNGIFDQEGGDDQIYLIVTWAILLCTIVGPLIVGLMARRVKRLEKGTKDSGANVVDGTGKEHPLGIWKDI